MGTDDDLFMARALELAAGGPPTSPNPRVGALVVRDGEVVSEATHQGPGHLHAEAAALAGVDARGATVYVNLEPCCHEGRTPPCGPALADAGIARVVVGIEDADGRVRGRGIDYLRGHGIEVTTGVLEEEARFVNAPYLHQRATGRTFLSLKLALTLDGRLAARDGSARWITSAATRKEVHARRAGVDAVMVGAGTVLADNPRLTAREVAAARQPVRIVVDASGRVPATAALFDETDGDVVVATTQRAPHDAHLAWKEAGAEVLVLPESGERVDLQALLSELGRREMLEVYCEGGAALATALLRDHLVNRLELHYGPLLLGAGGPEIGDLGITTMSEAGAWRVIATARRDDDVSVTLAPRDA